MTTLDPERAALLGRIGAHRLHATHDSAEITKAAREASATALDARLLAEIDPDGALSEAERLRRLAHARRAHFARLALRSAQARGRRQKGGAS